MKFDPKLWTFGIEHEWADYDRTIPLPKGNANNHKDFTIVNSNGIANDPKDHLYKFGGEINTRPTSKMQEQVEILEDLKHKFKKTPPQVNYRSNLHIHIRVPGLNEDLASLKHVQQYIHTHMPKAFKIIEPIPAVQDKFLTHASSNANNGAQARYERRLVSHQTLLSAKVLKKQLAAKTVTGFFEAEVPTDAGKPLWHLQARVSVNLRQLLETDTIEFRHFPGTLSPSELLTCLHWCKKFLINALEDNNVQPLLEWAKGKAFPKFHLYDHDLEVRYRATTHDGSLTKAQIASNIQCILDGSLTFEGM